MTTAVSNPPVSQTTYLGRLQSAFNQQTSTLPVVKQLNERISKPLDFLSAHVNGLILNNKLDELRPYLTEGLEFYESICKGSAAATQTLKQFRSILETVPEKVVLPVEVIKHMEQLCTITDYREKEEACLTARTALQEIVKKLDDVVKRSETFMESMKKPLNTIAFEVKKMENKTGIFDLLPSRGHYYFDEALAAHRTPVKPADSTTTAGEAATGKAPPDRELGEFKTPPDATTPKGKNAAAELAASLS